MQLTVYGYHNGQVFINFFQTEHFSAMTLLGL